MYKSPPFTGSKRKSRLKNLLQRTVDFVARYSEEALRDAKNVDICLAAMCTPDLLAKIRYPVAYVELLRSCIEHLRFTVREVKEWDQTRDVSAERFTTLLEVLRSNVPPIDLSAASEIALIADGYRNLMQPFQFEGWAGDISLHFQLSSSFGRKGRVLSSAVRFAQSERCLELGTAYGMSALFILDTLKASKGQGHLMTVEGCEALHSLASGMLKARYGDMISCHLGDIQHVLPQLAKLATGIGFMFHDAGHSRDDYTRDFGALRNSFAPGAIVLIDDIRWEDLRITKAKMAHCYEGWMEIVADPKVRRAAEIDDNLGLLLLR